MDYMKSSDKFRLELILRTSRMANNVTKANSYIQLIENGAPEWIYRDEIDKLLRQTKDDNEWVYQHQVQLMLICPACWLKVYPKVMELRNDLKELGY